MKARTTSSLRSQRGIFVVLVGLMALIIIGLAGMAVDTMRLVLAARQLQDAADIAAHAGASVLRPDVVAFPDSLTAYRNSKRAIRGALSESHLQDASGSKDIPYNTGTKTSLDKGKFAWDGIIFPNRLRATVHRGIWCFDKAEASEPYRKRFIDLDNLKPGEPTTIWFGNKLSSDVISPERYYCRANAIEVTLSTDGIQTFLLGVLGINHTRSMTRSSIAAQRDLTITSTSFGPTCGEPTCQKMLSHECLLP